MRICFLFHAQWSGTRSTLEAAFEFLSESAIVRTEVENGFYGVVPFMVSKLLTDVPFSIIFNFVLAIIFLPLANLQYQHDHIVVFVFCLILTRSCALRLACMHRRVHIIDDMSAVWGRCWPVSSRTKPSLHWWCRCVWR